MAPSEPLILGEAAFLTQVVVETVFPLIPTVFWTAFGRKVPWSSDGGVFRHQDRERLGGGPPIWFPHLSKDPPEACMVLHAGGGSPCKPATAPYPLTPTPHPRGSAAPSPCWRRCELLAPELIPSAGRSSVSHGSHWFPTPDP